MGGGEGEKCTSFRPHCQRAGGEEREAEESAMITTISRVFIVGKVIDYYLLAAATTTGWAAKQVIAIK